MAPVNQNLRIDYVEFPALDTGKIVAFSIEDKVKAAGGAIVKEIFSFPGGRRFHFHDPSGNQLAVWTDVDSTRSS